MRRTGELPINVAAVSLMLFAFGHSPAPAAEVLVNGNLESSVSPIGWSLSTSITGMPGSSIPSAVEHNDGANEPTVVPGQLGLFIKPQAGNLGDYSGLNKAINLTLEQIYAGGIAGHSYTFTGHAYFGGDANSLTDDGYSGGVTNLDAASASGAVPSPTQSIFEVAFLNSSNAVLGSPTVLDLRTVQQNDAMWHLQTVAAGPAPAGTAKVRVRTALTDMVDNTGYQDVLLDNYSLKDNAFSFLELLDQPQSQHAGRSIRLYAVGSSGN